MCITYIFWSFIGFCGSEPSGIKVTTKNDKSIHVVWDTTKTNCGYTITGYKVYFNSVSPFKTYKNKDVSGAATDNVDVLSIIPGFSYNIFVKALTATGMVSNPTSVNYTHPHISKFTIIWYNYLYSLIKLSMRSRKYVNAFSRTHLISYTSLFV